MKSDPMEKSRGNMIGWLVWGCAALFYGFQFVLRVSPGVIAEDLMRDLALDACMTGVLASCYYIGYSAMQIPTGVILDRFGPRRPLVFACLLCCIGALIFGYAQSLTLLQIGRTFMGVGSAFAFLSCVKLASLYFPPRILSILVGLTLSVGTFGATVAGAPFGMLVDATNWRVANYVLAGVSLLIALAAWIVIRENAAHTASREENRSEPLIQGIKSVLVNPQTWIYGLYGFAMYVPLSGFADLWGTPFITEAYKMDKTTAAGVTSLFYIGLGFGAPLWSYWATRILSYRRAMMWGALTSTIFMTSVLYLPMSLLPLYVVMALAGFCAGSQFMAFAAVSALHPLHRTATSSGVHNMLCMLSGVAMQPLLGHFLDRCLACDPKCVGVMGRYTHEHFLWSLAIIPVFLVIAFVLTLVMKETFPRGAGAEPSA
ncbi:MAG: hypothetical protein C0514_05255 [Candidatus Puniceispirillum sp.]|nr:hypothetical protein [Candidatus Puniceispirillum sp.]